MKKGSSNLRLLDYHFLYEGIERRSRVPLKDASILKDLDMLDSKEQCFTSSEKYPGKT